MLVRIPFLSPMPSPRGALFVLILLGLMLTACDKAPVMPDPDPFRPTADFQYEIDSVNLVVSFSDLSVNAEDYAWEFGDGATSSEVNPTHTYAAEGTYTVQLTVTSVSDLSVTATQVLEVVKPSEPDPEPSGSTLDQLAGTDAAGKIWILQREEVAFGIGPAPLDVQYYAVGINDPLSSSPCTLDDEYTFQPDGTFIHNTNNTFTLDAEEFGGWNDNQPTGCNEESTPGIFTSSSGQDMSAFANGGDYTFQLADGELTLLGDGVYIANPAKNNDGDLGPDAAPQSQIMYSIEKLIDGPEVDSLVLSMSSNGAFWTFWMVHYDDESQMPAIPE